MKALTLKFSFVMMILSATLSSFACDKVAIWIESPSLGTQQESRELFKEVENRLEESLTQKKYKVIPMGEYTRGQELNVCELNLVVNKNVFGKLLAEVSIDSLEADFSERIHSDKGSLKEVLKRLPEAKDL